MLYNYKDKLQINQTRFYIHILDPILQNKFIFFTKIVDDQNITRIVHRKMLIYYNTLDIGKIKKTIC